MPTAVVTGAASGIGRALATQLAAKGLQVHLADLARSHTVADEIGGVAHRLDVSDPAAIKELPALAPNPTIVCLKAGIVGASMGAPWEVPPDEWHRLLGVNLPGVVNGLRAFVPLLLEADQTARILITASLAGLITFPGGGAHAATKHAVVAVAEQAALALADSPVTVTLLCPALVRTGMSEIGEDPHDNVAATALAAAEQGRFPVVPREWTGAVRHQSDMLLGGSAPKMPVPSTKPTTEP